MNIPEVFKLFKDSLEESAVIISQSGYLSQALFRYDRIGNFYSTADFGNLYAFGLGISLNNSNRVFIFQDSQHFFSNIESIYPILKYKPKNLSMVIFEARGREFPGEKSAYKPEKLDPIKLLKSIGFEKIFPIQKITNLQGLLKKISKSGDLTVLYIYIDEEDTLSPLIITLSSIEIKNRFTNFLK